MRFYVVKSAEKKLGYPLVYLKTKGNLLVNLLTYIGILTSNKLRIL